MTATLGSASATAPIAPARPSVGDASANELGTATIELAVPAGISGTQQLRITTDAGTDAAVDVEILDGDNDRDGTVDNSDGAAPLPERIIAKLGGLIGLLAALPSAIVEWIAGRSAKSAQTPNSRT